ncbi:WASH complex subunit 5-like [Nilaparvata lugens]|uniref:WASH complex subunit 5-like n=1 Tax=Nilaparvata lugens TaxID=108931 RepID=UPI00193DE27E|nr:WASH complex subunit 5-like [Nilaparvata lugens]
MSADDFLADNNPCGTYLLKLVSRGNAIIAELLRLKDYIPPVFKWDKKQDQIKYADIVSDFSYFEKLDEFDKKIENDMTLQDLDDEFREGHIDILERFYNAFESIQKYASDLNGYIEDLEEGVYIQQTLESVILCEEGKQLLCESVHLYGVMLIVVDLHISGDIRERLLVSYYRYSAQRASSSHIDDVCKLLRSTGFSMGKRPPNYPEDYFRRTPLKDDLIDLVIGRLRSDDIYNQMSAYPHPDHRSTALANQAAMLHVCLYFQPQTLHNQQARMRETIDKFFNNNWVISIYMGLTVNLVDAWEPYKAARQALANTLQLDNIKREASEYLRQLEQLIETLQHKLKAGGINKMNVLEHINKDINLVRKCNVTLRWLMLHTTSSYSVMEGTKKSKQIRDMVMEVIQNNSRIFQLLLDTSEFELEIKELFKVLLQERESEWEKCKTGSIERMKELSDVFSGAKSLARVEQNENLQKWFAEISNQIDIMKLEEPVESNNKIVRLIQALDEVQGFHQLTSNHMVTQLLSETRKLLHQMVHGNNIKESVLINLQIIGDFSYAWKIIETYTAQMQTSIKHEPSLVSKLRATFLKLSSAMEIPLMRINQAGSLDLVSVSHYYSHELVAYIRRVVHIIPESMFAKMADIVRLQTHVIRELPTRLDKDKLKEYAQLEERMKVAKLTHQVSVFTEGVLRMKSTLVGIVRIDPKQLLEDGIRKELVYHLATALHNNLTFNPKSKASELGDKLNQLAAIMDGHRRSFEYIQDYIGIYGLKIWSTVYAESAVAWFDQRTQKEVVNLKFFGTIQRAVSTCGLTGLDRLICFMIVTEMHNFMNLLQKKVLREKAWLEAMSEIAKALSPNFLNIGNPGKTYLQLVNRCMNLHRIWPQYLDCVLRVGQLQLLRKHIFYQLNTSCKFESKHLAAALETLNESLMNDIKHQHKDEKAGEASLLATELTAYLDWAGIGEPLSKIYLTTRNPPYFSLMSFLFVISQLSRMQFVTNIGNLVWKKTGEPLDGVPFVVGLQTLFRHLHPQVRSQLLLYLGQYVNSHINASVSSGNKVTDLSSEVTVTIAFLKSFCSYSGLPRTAITEHIPDPIIDLFSNGFNII